MPAVHLPCPPPACPLPGQTPPPYGACALLAIGAHLIFFMFAPVDWGQRMYESLQSAPHAQRIRASASARQLSLRLEAPAPVPESEIKNTPAAGASPNPANTAPQAEAPTRQQPEAAGTEAVRQARQRQREQTAGLGQQAAVQAGSSRQAARQTGDQTAGQRRQSAGKGALPVEEKGASRFEASGTGASFAAPLAGNPKPPYPPLARQRGQEGVVLLKINVRPDGSPAGVTVERSSGFPLLDQSALATVRKWRFAPLEQGESRREFLLPIEFRLE